MYFGKIRFFECENSISPTKKKSEQAGQVDGHKLTPIGRLRNFNRHATFIGGCARVVGGGAVVMQLQLVQQCPATRLQIKYV